MKSIAIIPEGWACKIEECRPGYFMYKDLLCFKSEYGANEGGIEAFNVAGEYFMPRNVYVQPVTYEIKEEDL